MIQTRNVQLVHRDMHRWSAFLVIAGLVTIAAGAVFSLERAWGNLLLVASLLTGLGLGGAFFLAFHGVTGARWSQPLLPAARLLAGTLPLSATAAGVVVLAGLFFYPWALGEAAHGETFWFKNMWLSPAFFVGRSVVYVVLWAWIGRVMSTSRSPGGSLRSALILVLLASTVGLAAIDWIMSLEPLWFSTMFGVYQFAGVFLSGLAALVLLAASMDRQETGCNGFGTPQLHDMGKLLFGFSCFWMYIWFSQYMLIWYVNITEESVYFIRRMQGFWWPVALLSLTLNWVIPFFALLPRPAKCNWRVMVRVSLVILVGRWVDLYLMVLPSLSGEYPPFGLSELGGLLLAVGLVTLLLAHGSRLPNVTLGQSPSSIVPAS